MESPETQRGPDPARGRLDGGLGDLTSDATCAYLLPRHVGNERAQREGTAGRTHGAAASTSNTCVPRHTLAGATLPASRGKGDT